jgi:hypothetical protein
MPNAIAERGAISSSHLDSFEDYHLKREWNNYGKNLLYSLKSKIDEPEGITKEKQINYLKRLDFVLEEIGNNLKIEKNKHLTFTDYIFQNLQQNLNVKEEFPSKNEIFLKFFNLAKEYCKEKVEKGEVDKFDALKGYKNFCNLIQNTRRSIRKVLNNEPLYLIQQERNNFWHLANEMSYLPEKRY